MAGAVGPIRSRRKADILEVRFVELCHGCLRGEADAARLSATLLLPGAPCRWLRRRTRLFGPGDLDGGQPVLTRGQESGRPSHVVFGRVPRLGGVYHASGAEQYTARARTEQPSCRDVDVREHGDLSVAQPWACGERTHRWLSAYQVDGPALVWGPPDSRWVRRSRSLPHRLQTSKTTGASGREGLRRNHRPPSVPPPDPVAAPASDSTARD